MLRHGFAALCVLVASLAAPVVPASAQATSSTAQPLAIGETFTIDSLAKGFGAFLEANAWLKARLFIAHSGEPSIADV